MITLHHAQMLMSAFQALTSITGMETGVEHRRLKLRALEAQLAHRERTMETQLSHDREMFDLKADLVRDLIKALIDGRIDAVRKGFTEALAVFSEQCRHYMAQHERYAEAEIKATDPLERASIQSRMSDIDLQLSDIRSEAGNLYREMTKVILLIGGTMPVMSHEDQRALAVTKTN
jgi:hypothetical protein